jgi:hypothetical protein
VLAGESAPFNQFEMAALTDKVFDELGLKPPDNATDAAVAFTSVMADLALSGETPLDTALGEVAQVCIELDYLKEIYDFYLLRFAREDLQSDEVQYYWPGGNRENIDEITRDRFASWLAGNPHDV